ncbi:MAG: hypothetical protein Q7J86_05045, partial [Bacteroidota bacterium]|nr:hypothetical protein [Bacteroidota bacterium]
AFAVYKLNNWAFSAGFGPNGDGGSVKYNKGLPSFEKLISSIPAGLNSSGIPTSEYSSNIRFEGSSVFWGAQLNGSYAINDIISVSAGVRVIMANNTYNGYLKDIMINPNRVDYGLDGSMRPASPIFETFSIVNSAAANSLDPLIAEAGGLTLEQIQEAGFRTATEVAMLSAGLGSDYNSSMTVIEVQNAYKEKTKELAATSLSTADKTVDTKQTGTGFTPIVGIDIHLDKLNIGLKYEHQTVLKLTNTTVVDGTGLFPDGEESRSDLPSIIAAGADYMATDKLKVSGSFTMFLDKNIGWGGNVYKQVRTIDKNSMEVAFGLEYKLTDDFALSAGYMNSKIGVSEQFQSDFSFGNNYNTAGLGFQWNLNDRLVIDAGATLITYKDATKTFTADFDELADKFGEYNETYGKETFAVAFGIGYKIMEFKTKRRRRR